MEELYCRVKMRKFVNKGPSGSHEMDGFSLHVTGKHCSFSTSGNMILIKEGSGYFDDSAMQDTGS